MRVSICDRPMGGKLLEETKKLDNKIGHSSRVMEQDKIFDRVGNSR